VADGVSIRAMSELTMSKADREAFLADVHVGIVGIAREGAPPLTAPVWYSYEPGGDVVFAFAAGSEKISLLRTTGEASLCAQTESMPYKYVTVEGPVVIEPPDVAVETALAYRYLGEEIGDIYLGASADEITFVVRLTTARWRTVDYGPFVERALAGG
jgi:nitroimidazol reductase NimA-like FMN-containing flavoprotein (pyridoxamine 5'-phosphate oxidase superfamily)